MLALPAFTVALAEFPRLAVEDCSRRAVPSLAPVQLRKGATAIRLVVQVVRHVRRPRHAAKLAGGGGLASGSWA